MCGRYVSVQSDAALLEEFEAIDATRDAAEGSPTSMPARREGYNLAPTDAVRAVVRRRTRDAEGKPGDYARQLRLMRWGLVPSWAKDRRGAARMINARVESAPSAAAFRRAWAARRCLVPADGWYEWRTADGKDKQAFYMTAADGSPLAFAGLYEFWGPAGATLATCAILTADAVGNLTYVHDRMPLVVPRSGWADWLDPEREDPAELIEGWRTDDALGHLQVRPVSSAVNSVRNDGPDLLAPLDPDRPDLSRDEPGHPGDHPAQAAPRADQSALF